MLFTRKMLATGMIAAAGATGVAIALSAPATADPAAAAPVPSIPGLPFLQQLAANPAAATQLMQTFTSVLSGAQAAAPAAAPATPPPAATASVTLPQAPALPAAAPAATPAAAAAPVAAAQSLIPSGEVNLPNVPFLPVPLPQQVNFPGDLGALMPGGLAGAKPVAAPAVPAAAAPAASAPAAATGAGLAPLLMPLSALP